MKAKVMLKVSVDAPTEFVMLDKVRESLRQHLEFLDRCETVGSGPAAEGTQNLRSGGTVEWWSKFEHIEDAGS